MKIPRFDTAAIKAARSIPDVLAARGWPLDKSSDGWRGPCPVHKGEDKTAFHVLPDGRWCHCFTQCGRVGDVIALVRALDSLTFKQACVALGGTEISTNLPRPKHTPPTPAPPLPELNAAKRKEMIEMAERLASDPGLIESLARSRGWDRATISMLAWTHALGWTEVEAGADGAICFIYPNAVKVRGLWRDGDSWRWHRPDGSKDILWIWRGWPWNALELWREDRLRLPRTPRGYPHRR